MTINDSQEFKEFINRDFGITILSKYSAKNHVGEFAERMEFLSDKDMRDVYPQLLLFCADSDGIIINTSRKSRSVTLLLLSEG